MKTVIACASAGAGHLKAAEAIFNYFRSKNRTKDWSWFRLTLSSQGSSILHRKDLSEAVDNVLKTGRK